jgi:hypothetical protein
MTTVTVAIPKFITSHLKAEMDKLKHVNCQFGAYGVKGYADPEQAVQDLLAQAMVTNGLKIDGSVRTRIQSAHSISIDCEFLTSQGVRYGFYGSIDNYGRAKNYSDTWHGSGSLSYIIEQTSYHERTGRPQ